MTNFKKELERFFVYFFAGISIFIVIFGVQRAKQGDQFTTSEGTKENDNSSNGSSQQASIFDIFTNTANKVLAASEEASAEGELYPTPWGDLATKVTVRDGKITSVDIPTLPDSPPSIYAKPILIRESMRMGSANVQAVTGATITTNAFKSSLESALAKAKTKKGVVTSKTSPTKNVATGITKQAQNVPTDTLPAMTPVVPVVQQTNTVPVPAGVSGTFTGNAVPTPWGNAVASVTLVNGRLTNVLMPTVPDSPPSVYAKSYLIRQALSSGNANIQGVSGATITSLAFKASLENALGKAATQGSVIVQPVVPQQLPPSPPAPVPTPVIIPPVITQPATTPTAIAPASISGTFVGNTYNTNWGPASASATFINGKITAVTMPQVPQSPPSIQAEPFLVAQALAAGSANIQGVSGATIVSNAFKLSLESAIAKASAQGTLSTPAPTTVIQAPTATPTTRRSRHDDDD